MDTPDEERQWSLWMPLRQLAYGFALENGEHVLGALAESIRASCARADDVSTSDGSPEEYVDAVVDHECDLIERLLGVSFVVCQTFIAETTSNVRFLHTLYERYFPGDQLSSTGTGKRDLMQFGSPQVADSPHSQITVIDAFANYYKHEDEWTRPWERMQRDNQRYTAGIIKAVGATEGSTGNFRTAAEVLGNPQYADTAVFHKRISGWSSQIYRAYHEELRGQGLVPDEHV